MNAMLISLKPHAAYMVPIFVWLAKIVQRHIISHIHAQRRQRICAEKQNQLKYTSIDWLGVFFSHSFIDSNYSCSNRSEILEDHIAWTVYSNNAYTSSIKQMNRGIIEPNDAAFMPAAIKQWSHKATGQFLVEKNYMVPRSYCNLPKTRSRRFGFIQFKLYSRTIAFHRLRFFVVLQRDTRSIVAVLRRSLTPQLTGRYLWTVLLERFSLDCFSFGDAHWVTNKNCLWFSCYCFKVFFWFF